MTKIQPPGLPPRLIDESESVLDVQAQSSWDVLAETALDMRYRSSGNRERVRWLRYSLLFWHCWRPMRLGAVEIQPKNAVFGWQRENFKVAACRHCGFIRPMVGL